MLRKKKKIRALVLLSGGLDSMLAAKILKEQGLEVVGLTFKSYFFGTNQAEQAAKNLAIPLKIIDFSKEHLKVVKAPKHGWGKTMNPCIDCHALMLKRAKKIMKDREFDLVATGEVLGERPMSQNRKALKIVEKESGLEGYLLRPLSAKRLEETIPEKKGWVERNKLFAISGRQRRKQIELAKKWKIKKYPSPAGGCLLTDLEFSKKLKILLKKYPQAQASNLYLLRVGRHFWFGLVKVVVGRNHEENLRIKELLKKGDILLEPKDIPGPTTLIRNYERKSLEGETLEKAKDLTRKYISKAKNKKEINFKVLKI